MIASPASENTPPRQCFRSDRSFAVVVVPGGAPPSSITRKHPDRLDDVFDRLLAKILVVQCELVPDLFVDRARDVDPARFREAFEACGNVDPVAVDLFAVDHHISEVDADAELHPALGRDIRVLSLERGLDFDGALDRIHDAGEFCQHAVSRGINETSVMLLDERVD
jgi:hypothetical protein